MANEETLKIKIIADTSEALKSIKALENTMGKVQKSINLTTNNSLKSMNTALKTTANSFTTVNKEASSLTSSISGLSSIFIGMTRGSSAGLLDMANLLLNVNQSVKLASDNTKRYTDRIAELKSKLEVLTPGTSRYEVVQRNIGVNERNLARYGGQNSYLGGLTKGGAIAIGLTAIVAGVVALSVASKDFLKIPDGMQRLNNLAGSQGVAAFEAWNQEVTNGITKAELMGQSLNDTQIAFAQFTQLAGGTEGAKKLADAFILLQATTGRGAEDLTERFRSAFTGSVEAIENVLPGITRSLLNSMAMTKYGVASFQTLNAGQQKTIMLQAIVEQTFKQTGGTMKAGAATALQYEAQIANLKLEWGRFASVLSLYVLPILTNIVKFMNSSLKFLGFKPAQADIQILNQSTFETANNLYNANANAKALKNTLAGFDEINNISNSIPAAVSDTSTNTSSKNTGSKETGNSYNDSIWGNIQRNWGTFKQWWVIKAHEWKMSMAEIGGNLWEGTKNGWEKFKVWLKDKWDKAGVMIFNVKTITTQKTEDLYNWFSGLGSKMAEAFKKGWSGLKKFFTALLITPMNSLIDSLNETLSFTIPKWIPKYGGKQWGLNLDHIPQLANGGVVNSATLAMIGEAGSEAVVPLKNNTEWVGQVAGLLQNAMGNGSQPLNITLEVNGTAFGRVAVDSINKLTKQNGRLMLNI